MSRTPASVENFSDQLRVLRSKYPKIFEVNGTGDILRLDRSIKIHNSSVVHVDHHSTEAIEFPALLTAFYKLLLLILDDDIRFTSIHPDHAIIKDLDELLSCILAKLLLKYGKDRAISFMASILERPYILAELTYQEFMLRHPDLNAYEVEYPNHHLDAQLWKSSYLQPLMLIHLYSGSIPGNKVEDPWNLWSKEIAFMVATHQVVDSDISYPKTLLTMVHQGYYTQEREGTLKPLRRKKRRRSARLLLGICGENTDPLGQGIQTVLDSFVLVYRNAVQLLLLDEFACFKIGESSRNCYCVIEPTKEGTLLPNINELLDKFSAQLLARCQYTDASKTYSHLPTTSYFD